MHDFDAVQCLAKATLRAKSDVANKLVSMALHRLSQTLEINISVRSEAYQEAVRASFNNYCPYCEEKLTAQNTILEHLDAMNQFRAGLHIPGNVLPACKDCNLEKRRDDQKSNLPWNMGGWESFLGHDTTRCSAECKTCRYWTNKWPDLSLRQRQQKLRARHAKITDFRDVYLPPKAKGLSQRISPLLRGFYEKAQTHAKAQTDELVQMVIMLAPELNDSDRRNEIDPPLAKSTPKPDQR